ncbi:MAG: ABC transporter permease [Spirochaetales bacterium]|nr:ABC transporter permease [Spirochaetales bacterium]
MKTSIKALSIVPIFVYIFLWAPVVVLIVLSFSTNEFGIRWEEFTFKWYGELFSNELVRQALTRSLYIAIITVIFSTTLGTLTAYGLYKLKFRFKKALRTTILLPIVLPYVVTGSALLVFFAKFMHLTLGNLSIIIAHITFSTPLAVFVILGRMQRIDWATEEAAWDLGANKITAFFKVIGPAMLPGISAAAMLVFPWSFDDFVITYFVAGVGTTTLPIYVFSQLRYGATPVINTIGTLFVIVTMLLLVLSGYLQNKGQEAIIKKNE